MNRLTLVTIPLSHFCEKARWALDLAGLRYEEEGHAPLMHLVGTRRRGGRSTPLLVTPDGVLRDSTDILAWVDRRHPLYPQWPDGRADALALEEELDTQLGPHVRRLGYYHVFQVPAVARRLVTHNAPRWEAGLVRAGFPILRGLMRKSMRIDAEGARRSHDKVVASFDAVSKRLADGRRYLVGEAFGAADLTFAALAGPILFPPEHPMPWPPAHERPAALREISEALAATPAGQHALRMYRAHRPLRGLRPVGST